MMLCNFFFLIFSIKAYVVGTHLNCINLSTADPGVASSNPNSLNSATKLK